MITLITGLPGNGKTLYAIAWLKEKAERERRQVYYSGITDCKVPGWVELVDAEQWMTVPKGGIVLVDEVQRLMRPRMHGAKVPPFVEALETHRHLGVDLVFITQHPMLLDSNVRRLVGQHKHVVRKFGTGFATVHEWTACKETCDKNREDSVRHEFKYPADVFALYKSSELHTVRRNIPAKVWVFLSLPFVLAVICWYAWQSLQKQGSSAALAGNTPGAVGSVSGASGRSPVKTPVEYVQGYAPRVEGLPHTAAVYDGVTVPVRAPYPAACVQMGERCACFTEQATKLAVTDAICRAVVAGGYFVEWRTEEPRGKSEASLPKPLSSKTASGSDDGAAYGFDAGDFRDRDLPQRSRPQDNATVEPRRAGPARPTGYAVPRPAG